MKRCVFLLLLLVGITFAASAEEKADQLLRYFKNNNYRSLFVTQNEAPVDSIWLIDSCRIAIDTILRRHTAPDEVLFICAEICFKKKPWTPTREECQWLAPLYAKALKENFTGIANPWGLPDDTGEIGEHVALMGEAAVKAFKRLLKCNTQLTYIGSRDATTGKMYRFRVKDVAAAQIMAILGEEWKVEQAPHQRDKTIRKMKRMI